MILPTPYKRPLTVVVLLAISKRLRQSNCLKSPKNWKSFWPKRAKFNFWSWEIVVGWGLQPFEGNFWSDEHTVHTICLIYFTNGMSVHHKKGDNIMFQCHMSCNILLKMKRTCIFLALSATSRPVRSDVYLQVNGVIGTLMVASGRFNDAASSQRRGRDT